ncbi:MAG: PLP-dependent aminotransferase family protein [Paludibacteraceae bacterium]|nr:PLP-dependent aminotransferase family protein [Paludibacteraceae bacterium]
MNFNFADSAKKMRSSAIRDLMSLAVRPDIISFAGGMPGNDLFPIDDLREIFATLPTKKLEIAMQYGETSGMNTLIAALKDWLKQKGFPVDTNRVILTTGTLQALHILGKIFINPGDTILVENPSFVGALSAFKLFEANIVGVNIDKNGICIDDLKEKLKLNPKFLYIMPNFHNPAGIIYSQK